LIFKSKNISDLIGINSQEAKSNLLKDMLKLLYSKLDSIVQIHAFILNTSEKMLKVYNIKIITFKKLINWLIFFIYSFIKTYIHIYYLFNNIFTVKNNKS